MRVAANAEPLVKINSNIDPVLLITAIHTVTRSY